MAIVNGKEFLERKLISKRTRVLLRYDFYDMKNIIRDFDISTPPKLRWWQTSLGWCGKAVDSLADRLNFRTFKNDNFALNEIFMMNNADILCDSAFLGALISSCDFIYIYPDENGYPKLEVIDGSNATGTLDTTTNLLTEGWAVLERDKFFNPVVTAYFEPFKTTYYRNGKEERVYKHNVAYPLLVPIIYKPDAKRPFGHSRISRACMDIQASAIRTIKRSEISAEFFSFPQRYVVGLAQDAEPMDKWKVVMSSLLTFTKDEDGESPTLGQFQQQSMEPHLAQLKLFASLFAGETGLTLDDLGFPTENPSSSEAIKAAHENLRLTARKAQKSFGAGLINAGMLAASLRDNYPYSREVFYDTKVVWSPVFEPDFSALSQVGDGIIKINQAIPNFINEDVLSEIIGIEIDNEA